jgi:nucleoside-diphosphate-sugar epimerase
MQDSEFYGKHLDVLLTGATGAIGRFLLKEIVKKHNVTVLCRDERKLPKEIPRNSYQVVNHDLTFPLPIIGEFDCMIHAAAISPNPQATTLDYVEGNVISTANVVERANQSKRCRFFFFLSTISVYDEGIYGLVDERTLITSTNTYGVTKHLAEKVIKDNLKCQSTYVLRLPGVIGCEEESPWLAKAAKSIFQNNKIEVFNSDSLFNSVIDTEEIYRCISHLLNFPVNGFNVINIAASEPITLRKVLELIAENSDYSLCLKDRFSTNSSKEISVKKVIEKFGFSPVSVRELILRVFRSHGYLLSD